MFPRVPGSEIRTLPKAALYLPYLPSPPIQGANKTSPVPPVVRSCDWTASPTTTDRGQTRLPLWARSYQQNFAGLAARPLAHQISYPTPIFRLPEGPGPTSHVPPHLTSRPKVSRAPVLPASTISWQSTVHSPPPKRHKHEPSTYYSFPLHLPGLT